MLEKIADGRTDLVFEHIKQGHDADEIDPSGVSLIQWCAYYGDVSAVRYLLEHGECLTSLGENFDLNGAVFHGHWQLCQFLLEQGADVNFTLPDSFETPLHAAICKANRPYYDLIIKLLLSYGADANAKTKPHIPTGSFMRDCKTKGETPLHRAAAFGSIDSIDILISAGAQVDAQDVNGDTPLSWASWHLRPEVVLKRLCYGKHAIHPSRNSNYDHGQGWGALESYLTGKPHL